MTANLAGKVAFVTGGSGDIGRATCLKLAQLGCVIVVADMNVEEGQETVGKVRAMGGEAEFCRTDVGDAESVQELVRFAVVNFGGLQIAINNAGLVPMRVPIVDLPKHAWDQNVRVNLTGVFLGMKFAIAHMIANGGGAIVNVSSVSAVLSVPGSHSYAAAKRGVLSLTSCAAIEYGRDNIRVNAIMPGYITGRLADDAERSDPSFVAPFRAALPTGEFGEPNDIAEAIAWLCSDQSRYVTGQALAVDGAMTA